MPEVLQRQHFSISRAAEYFKRSEMQAQTEQPVPQFLPVILKELVDNSLDAAESAGLQPHFSCLSLSRIARNRHSSCSRYACWSFSLMSSQSFLISSLVATRVAPYPPGFLGARSLSSTGLAIKGPVNRR